MARHQGLTQALNNAAVQPRRILRLLSLSLILPHHAQELGKLPANGLNRVATAIAAAVAEDELNSWRSLSRKSALGQKSYRNRSLLQFSPHPPAPLLSITQIWLKPAGSMSRLQIPVLPSSPTPPSTSSGQAFPIWGEKPLKVPLPRLGEGFRVRA